MSVDMDTVKRVASLARIALDEKDVGRMAAEFNVLLGFVAQLKELDVSNVEPTVSVISSFGPSGGKVRRDEVTEGGQAKDILVNAPGREDAFFVVPKMLE